MAGAHRHPRELSYVLMSMDDGDAVAETDEYDNIALRPLLIRRK